MGPTSSEMGGGRKKKTWGKTFLHFLCVIIMYICLFFLFLFVSHTYLYITSVASLTLPSIFFHCNKSECPPKSEAWPSRCSFFFWLLSSLIVQSNSRGHAPTNLHLMLFCAYLLVKLLLAHTDWFLILLEGRGVRCDTALTAKCVAGTQKNKIKSFL